MLTVGKIKWVERSGWVREKMPSPETVAEHTFRVALLARILAPFLGVDPERLTTMAIFHDLAEGILGDPVTQRGEKQVEQHNEKAEKRVMRKLFDQLGMPELYPYWEEHTLENGHRATNDSNLLYQFGKIATVWQALEYELRGAAPRRLDEFWENAKAHLRHPFLIRVLGALEKRRKI